MREKRVQDKAGEVSNWQIMWNLTGQGKNFGFYC